MKYSVLIVNTHVIFMMSLGIEMSDNDKRLPYLYWTPKLHKSPVKHHFIAGSSKCTTKHLSSLLTKILTVIKSKSCVDAVIGLFAVTYVVISLEITFMFKVEVFCLIIETTFIDILFVFFSNLCPFSFDNS